MIGHYDHCLALPQSRADAGWRTPGANRPWNQTPQPEFIAASRTRLKERLLKQGRTNMGRGILLWLLGVPIPIIILLALFFR